ncbi:MAG TPA: Uma2 family endonuclease [Chryseolinea sp.]|nr:Uma2 family endonuclease [Chryseolinea sp.]
MEVFQMLPEGTLAELINGSIYMSPASTTQHQSTILDLSVALSTYVKQLKLGKIFIAACDVYLDEHSNAVQPDILFISSKKSEIIKESGIYGVPDLLIEVLSPGNSEHDTIVKKELYRKFGVQEYWIINPKTKETIGYSLKNNAYQPLGQFIGNIHSALLNNQAFDF